jgi:hypothetical protein
VSRRAVRIANCSGFYGDRLSAAREMVEGGPIDVLTGDYLAELTMLILWKARQKDPASGYARTFLTQLEEVLGTCLDRGIRIVTNAGGLNPLGLADRIGTLAARLGLAPRVAAVTGDDLLDRLPELQEAGVDLAHLDTGSRWRRRGAGRSRRTPIWAAGGSRQPWRPAPTSSSARGSPTPRSWWDRRRGGTAGRAPTGTRWPGRSSPGT